MNCEDHSLEDLMEYFDSSENFDKNETYIIPSAKNATSYSPPKTRSKGPVEDFENVQQKILEYRTTK